MQEFFEHLLKVWGYPALFAGVMLENAGIPVPGETAVLFAGYFASEGGGHHLQIVLVILVTICAAVLGDNLGYWLGRRWARPRLQRQQRFLLLTPKTLAVAEGYFDRYGSGTIFFARFITGVRVFGALAAGTAGMPWPRFLLANALGAGLWACTISALGYFFGQYMKLLEKLIGGTGLVLLALGLFAGVFLFRHRHRLGLTHAAPAEELPDSDPASASSPPAEEPPRGR
jgi:membrane-associated protein